MRKLSYESNNQNGFTLVELLIVIVIIGVLAGVVIGVLNPVQQQNRARDGAIKAHIDKMALSTKSLYVSSPRSLDRAPTQAEFAAGISSSPDVATNCSSQLTTYSTAPGCLFQITGQPLAATCAVSGYNGTGGTAQCNYIYFRNGTEFKIAARGAATPEKLFVYSYSESATTGNIVEGFWSCPATFAIAAGAPAGCDRI